MVLIMASAGATPLFKNFILKIKTKVICKNAVNILEPLVLVTMLVIITAYLVDGSFNPFLYFRF